MTPPSSSSIAMSRPRPEWGWALLFGLVLAAGLAWSGPLGVLLLFLLLSGAGVVFLALRAPSATLALWLLCTMGVDILWVSSMPVGGGVDLRFSDPVLLGMVGALGVRLLRDDRRLYDVLLRYGLFWTLLALWLLVRVGESIGAFGVVSALGEFRTYFNHILILPYVVVFARTPQVRWRMFGVVVAFVLALIGVGYVQGGLAHGFLFAPYQKWLVSSPSLAVVYGAFAIYLLRRYRLWSYGTALYGGLLLLILTLTIISGHRSVWAASVVGIAALTMLGHVPIGKVLKLCAGVAGALLALDLLYDGIDIGTFLHDRLQAFVAVHEDSTANWRLEIWADAWRQSKEYFWTGKGLGNYFNLVDGKGNLVTVSLHNQYLQIIYQVGVVGLALYLAMAAQIARHLTRAYRHTTDRATALLTGQALVVLAAGSVFYLVYGFDHVTWVFVALGLAAAKDWAEHA